MQKNNVSTVTAMIVIVALVGGIFYLIGRDQSAGSAGSENSEASVVDHHGHDVSQNGSSEDSLAKLIGQEAPNFSLEDRDGNVYSSENLRGKKVLLFFNEGLMCYPACWNQIVALAEDERFKNDDTLVLSVVVDSKEDWQKAIDKMPELAAATVVFDTGGNVSGEFGVLDTPSSMHPGIFPGHTYVLIDKEGIVKYIFDDTDMGIRNDELSAEIAKL